MARLARVVLPGFPHHVIQRGGHLWQGRFASFVMEESYLRAAVRYVEMNPVRARIVREPWRYRWSSAKAHLDGQDDRLAKVAPLLDRYGDWRKVLAHEKVMDEPLDVFRRHERTGRVLGSEGFVAKVVRLVGREIRPGKAGRPRLDRLDRRDNQSPGRPREIMVNDNMYGVPR